MITAILNDNDRLHVDRPICHRIVTLVQSEMYWVEDACPALLKISHVRSAVVCPLLEGKALAVFSHTCAIQAESRPVRQPPRLLDGFAGARINSQGPIITGVTNCLWLSYRIHEPSVGQPCEIRYILQIRGMKQRGESSAF